MHKNPDAFAQAKARYEALRTESYKLFNGVAAALSPGLTVTRIDDRALKESDNWENDPNRRAAWSWRSLHAKFTRRPRRVEAAFWSNGSLLFLLCLGRVSNKRVNASIHFLEAAISPPVPLRGTAVAIATQYLNLYATLLQCSTIVIDSPVEALVEHYKRNGFTKEFKRGRSIRSLSQPVFTVPLDAL